MGWNDHKQALGQVGLDHNIQLPIIWCYMLELLWKNSLKGKWYIVAMALDMYQELSFGKEW